MFEPGLFCAVSSSGLQERASLLCMCALNLLVLVGLEASLRVTYEPVRDSDFHWSLVSMNVKQRYHRRSFAFDHYTNLGTLGSNTITCEGANASPVTSDSIK